MPDNCEICDGTRGVPGIENRIEGLTVCDYCHADMIREEEWLNMTLKRGKYIGPDEADQGKTALVKVFADRVEVQFDDFDHAKSHFWHPYPAEHWEIHPEDYDDE